jgi:MAF protein
MTRFLLASQSPRRKELLGLCAYPFQVIAAQVDETSIDHPDPATNALQTARLKAQAIYNQLLMGELLPGKVFERTIIIAADTIVALGGRMLGKPADTADAVNMLRELRDRRHEVHTGMALVDRDSGEEATAVHTAYVTMRDYSDREIERYVASGDPMDKAGAYAIQNRSFHPVESVEGCYLGVMGLTICQLEKLQEQLGIPVLTDPDKLSAAHNHHPCPLLL